MFVHVYLHNWKTCQLCNQQNTEAMSEKNWNPSHVQICPNQVSIYRFSSLKVQNESLENHCLKLQNSLTNRNAFCKKNRHTISPFHQFSLPPPHPPTRFFFSPHPKKKKESRILHGYFQLASFQLTLVVDVPKV